MNISFSNNYVLHLVVSRGVAAIGNALASFGIDVWFYQTTGSYSNFATIYILTTLPPILISPLAGFLSDRLRKSKILYLSELVTLLLALILAVCYIFESLEFPVLAACIFFMAVASEFRYTAMTALIPELAKKAELNSVNGIQQAFRGAVVVTGPLLGAVAYSSLGLLPLLMIAALSCGYAIVVARALMSFEANEARRGMGPISWMSFVNDYAVGLRWLRSVSSLTTILLHFTLICGFLALFRTLTVPHILDAMGQGWLALVVSAQGAGLLIAGIFLAKVGGSARPDRLLFAGCYTLSLSIIAFALCKTPFVLTVSAFAIGASICFVSASNQTIWQTLTPTEIQGKIVALRSMMLYVFSPMSIYISVPLAEHFKSKGVGLPFSIAGIGQPTWSGLVLALVGVTVLVSSLISQLIYKFDVREPSIFSQDGKHEQNQTT
ncbi:MFS transporter [Cupriavidus gilardii]|uniref:MFS transporter n=1 Tax=Cupriavidus gilardii TaxID=82541 RepID=UPI000B05483B|nr:MFS transporter [Cupriavidus gilardii]